jgi:prophage regulatory protein
VQRRPSRRNFRTAAAIANLSSLLRQSPEERTSAGGDSSITGLLSYAGCDAFVRIDTVMALVGLSVPTIYRLMSKGDFPRPVKLTTTARGWRLSDLISWMRGREVESGNTGERV